MRTIAQLTTELTPYLAKATGNSAGTTVTAMLNLVLPRLYSMGDWKALETRWETDVSAGYFALPPDYECILRARIYDLPVEIHALDYDFQAMGPGYLGRPVGHSYGIIDRGYSPLTSEIADVGCDELIFTSTAAFASGDTAKITYTDSEDDYTQVTLPLHTISVTISGAASGGTGLTDLTVASSAGLVAGLGLIITQVSGTDASYINTFRIASTPPDATTVIIEKDYVALTGSVAGASTPRLMPANAISSVEELVYTSLPARTLVKDADGIIYSILMPGDGVAEFRWYEVPQVPADTADEWTLSAIVKRKFNTLTASTDVVYLDNITALRYACQAASFEDEGDYERAHIYWGKAKKALDDSLFDQRGGITKIPEINVWGDGIPGLPCYY